MNTDEILRRCDHTVLNRDATWEDVRKACDQAVRFDTASVCIPPCFVKQAAEYLAGRKAVCTVTGFPNGYSTVAAKAYETRDAVKNGADEIDAVINVCAVKARDRRYLTDEVLALREASKDKILKIGYVDDEDVPVLLSGALMFVMPSIYEGFGMPVLEAMKCECPVICSKTSAMPEVIGDCGIMVDPYEDAEMISAYSKMYFNETFRKKCIAKGVSRAKKFTWERCAGVIIDTKLFINSNFNTHLF